MHQEHLIWSTTTMPYCNRAKLEAIPIHFYLKHNLFMKSNFKINANV